tara:strand:+ start:4529 stop:4681 length:153 start_codon:yes stop_codon:yes gene_type:complete
MKKLLIYIPLLVILFISSLIYFKKQEEKSCKSLEEDNEDELLGIDASVSI